MVATVSFPASAARIASPGSGFDGVVRISSSGFFGSGVVLPDGRSVLTAAHLFGVGGPAGTVSVRFETAAGVESIAAGRVLINPRYNPVNSDNDLAVVRLASAAPLGATRHGLYRGVDEVGQTFTFAGYGQSGSGSTGAASTGGSTTLRLQAQNVFDAGASDLKAVLGNRMGWTPAAGTQLIADFDDGSSVRDALGQFLARPQTGLGAAEGLIAPGDSGGPAFLGGRVAGVASYTASLSSRLAEPDVDTQANSSFGEIGFWQRVSAYQQFIDQALRAFDTEAPTTPEQVRLSVAEGASGTSLAYFLVRFLGTRESPDQVVSVDYTTRDGTARAGEDYVAVEGRLVLYPDESYAAIPVEIIGDRIDERDETFFLDVTNPQGGTFPMGLVTLVAMRTILDDDL
jgi:hypothetical protein